MSLTSYRAAPPRAKGFAARVRLAGRLCLGCEPVVVSDRGCEGMVCLCWSVAIALGRSGGDRLSRALRHSTMGAGAFNGRVRDGIGFGHTAQATRPAQRNRLGSGKRVLM